MPASQIETKKEVPMFQCEDLSVGYGVLQIVYGASVIVYSGAITTIIGPNGSGKSTLIKGMVNLAKLFGGKITLEGRDVTHSSTNWLVRHGVGIVPQVSNVFTNLTVSENLEMGGYSQSRSIVKRRIEEMLSLFPELGTRKKAKAATLSGGERQMLAVARALMIGPKVLVLDEPTANLSPVVISKMHVKLKEISQSGIAVLMVEQNARKALEISDYGNIMVAGRIVHSGPARSILDDPEFGKAFLGLRSEPSQVSAVDPVSNSVKEVQ
jgi:branched-chain amino acid transport system ATP-binding protein